MAKRKNPLKDLDSFLNQEASSIVQPDKVEESAPPVPETDPIPIVEPSTVADEASDKSQVITYLKSLSDKDPEEFRNTLYEIIKTSLENGGAEDSADKMLMNTVLYLNHPEDWKEVIKAYWKGV